MSILIGNLLLAGVSISLYVALARVIQYFDRQGRRYS